MLAPQPENLPLTVRLGIDAAQTIRDVLLESSEQALTDKQQGSLSRTFCDVVDAIIAGGGMVGGLGERYTWRGGGAFCSQWPDRPPTNREVFTWH